MTKRRTGVSLDPDVAEAKAEDDGDFSPLVNKWARDYYIGGKRPVTDRERVKQMLDELNKVESQYEEHVQQMRDLFSRQRAMLNDALGEAPTSDEEYEDAIETVYNKHTNRSTTPGGTLVNDYSTPRNPENPAMRNEAERLGISPEHLVEELLRRDRRDGFADTEVDR